MDSTLNRNATYLSTRSRLAEFDDQSTVRMDWFGHGDRRVEWLFDYASNSLSVHGNGGEIAAWDSLQDAYHATIELIAQALNESDIDADALDIAWMYKLGNLPAYASPESIALVYGATRDEIIGIARRNA